MIKKELEIIVKACIKRHGLDFTQRIRSNEYIYPRAAFIKIVRDRYKRKASLQLIGDVLGGLDHATVLHAYNRATDELDGRYLYVKEFNDVLKDFRDLLSGIIEIKNMEEIRTYSADLTEYIDRLQSENADLKAKIIEQSEIISGKRIDIEPFLVEISELPNELKEEFRIYKWLPFKKMQESREHYNIVINEKRIR